MSAAGVRNRGRQTRGRLLDAAVDLFTRRDRESVSVAEIARAAGAHPNQVTYYFGSKDALYVEAACRTFLQQTVAVTRAGARATTPEDYRGRVARAAVRLAALPALAEALLLVRSRPALATITGYALDVLFRQSAGSLTTALDRHGWVTKRPVAEEVQRFWCAVLGAALLRASGASDVVDPAVAADSLGIQEAP